MTEQALSDDIAYECLYHCVRSECLIGQYPWLYCFDLVLLCANRSYLPSYLQMLYVPMQQLRLRRAFTSDFLLVDKGKPSTNATVLGTL